MIIPDGHELCPECLGKKEMIYSCCSGDPVDEDYMMCPECHEHLGYEDCETCNGIGYIKTEHDTNTTNPETLVIG